MSDTDYEARSAAVERLMASMLTRREAIFAAYFEGERAGYVRALEIAIAGAQCWRLGMVGGVCGGEPVAYLTGRREFFGLEFEVTPAVLIPRPETERLVELVLERVPAGAAARVLDLGTGSGCVAIAVARHCPRAQVLAVDSAAGAVELARRNAKRHGTPNVRVVRSDWFAALAHERFDVIAANPPYVAAGDPHLDAGDLRFEPRQALVAGSAGTECIAAITAAARAHLSPGGWFFFEHGPDQGGVARERLRAAGFTRGVGTWRDLAGLERVSGAQVDPSGRPR